MTHKMRMRKGSAEVVCKCAQDLQRFGGWHNSRGPPSFLSVAPHAADSQCLRKKALTRAGFCWTVSPHHAAHAGTWGLARQRC